MRTNPPDVILVGAGLANGLLALRLKAARPHLRIVALDQRPGPADAHTWSFFDTDLPRGAEAWLKPLVRRSWPAYRVRFPGLVRELATPYSSIDETALDAALASALGEDLRRGVEVIRIEPAGVTLAGGERMDAPLVIDGRGARPSPALWLAWQKFRGIEVQLKKPHNLETPVVMDADVPQTDGYRFLYVLPFEPRTLLVEDTCYSASPSFDGLALEASAIRYARASGWCVGEVTRRESGVLPIALGGDIDRFWAEQPQGVPAIGMRAALFHPTTGYSLPDAAEVAQLVAAAPSLESRPVRALIEAHSRRRWRERSFYRALNRMMFLAAEDQERWRVLARFYRLPKPLIERFYAGRSTAADKLRLVSGRPPVPIGPALSALVARPAPEEAAA